MTPLRAPKPPVPPEIAVQASIIDAIRKCVSPVDVRAVPNGARVSASGARRLKREGMVAGTPDLICTWPGGVGFLEVKRPGYSPSAVSPEQRELIALWRAWGLNVAVVATPETALMTLAHWGAPMRVNPETFVSIGEAANRVLARMRPQNGG